MRPSGLRERDVGRSLVFAACRVRERHLELTGIGRSEGEREVLVDDFTLDGILSRTFPTSRTPSTIDGIFRKSGTAHATWAGARMIGPPRDLPGSLCPEPCKQLIFLPLSSGIGLAPDSCRGRHRSRLVESAVRSFLAPIHGSIRPGRTVVTRGPQS